MAYSYFSRNGAILPIEQAVVPLGNVEYSYGFGVYETIRVSKGTAYFLEEHCQRLMESAKIISLAHTFSAASVQAGVKELLEKNSAETCNLKVLLIGSPAKEAATLNIMCLNPLFPDRKLYKSGAACTTYNYERDFPGAKTLNMLPSYLAYRQAAEAGAYDALLVNRQGCITEGTRTNFFGIKDKQLISPPAETILPGVTRHYVIKLARQNGFKVAEQNVKLSDIGSLDGAFLTSTPIKIMPIRSIGQHAWQTLPPTLYELMAAFDEFLRAWR
jgi:branched-chain amino acid aminotransferase